MTTQALPTPSELQELLRYLEPQERAELDSLIGIAPNRPPSLTEPPPGLADFVESTVSFKLHDWQRNHLCPILQRLATEKGLRILLHGPPQFGKSVIVSQRLPAYLMGCDPARRVGLACYNETHATGFGQVIKDLMASEDYTSLFPASVIDKDAPAARFSTTARKAKRDAQPSFLAMGLLSGFTGKGVDALIIDDPYKSAEDARSVTINEKVWRWWEQTAKVRLSEETNVVVMFHRYHEDDFAARLEAEGGWEFYRFAALADENADGSDPTGRAAGEPLSPMRSRAYLDALRESDPVTFAGQFQGRPIPESGNFFDVSRIAVLDAAPVDIVRSVRAWDIAASEGRGDYTAGVKIGRHRDGSFWLLDVVLGQWGPEEADRHILQTAALDGAGVPVRLAIDPGSAGKRDALALTQKLAGFAVESERVTGPKPARAKPLASQVNVGNVRAVRCEHLASALRQFAAFPNGAFDDAIDAAADAFNALTAPPESKAAPVSPVAAMGGAKRPETVTVAANHAAARRLVRRDM